MNVHHPHVVKKSMPSLYAMSMSWIYHFSGVKTANFVCLEHYFRLILQQKHVILISIWQLGTFNMDFKTIWFCQSAKIQLLTFSFLFFFCQKFNTHRGSHRVWDLVHLWKGAALALPSWDFPCWPWYWLWLCLKRTHDFWQHNCGERSASRDTPQKTWNGWKVARSMSVSDHLVVISKWSFSWWNRIW